MNREINHCKTFLRNIIKCTSPSVFKTYDRVRKAATSIEGVESEDTSCRNVYVSSQQWTANTNIKPQVGPCSKPAWRGKLENPSESVHSSDPLYLLA